MLAKSLETIESIKYNYTTYSNEQDGVAKWLERFLVK